MEYEKIEHIFEPVYDEYSEILILGTFPSVKSRENNFYYGHPQNRFWKVIANINNVPVPESIDEKRKLLLDLHIAIWDVVASCSISGSSDSSIKDVTANDISKLLKDTNIKTIYGNGAKACELYNRYVYSKTGRAIVKLPSTSPANAGYSLERLCELWRKEVIAYLQRAVIPEEAPNVETIGAFSELENGGE